MMNQQVPVELRHPRAAGRKAMPRPANPVDLAKGLLVPLMGLPVLAAVLGPLAGAGLAGSTLMLASDLVSLLGVPALYFLAGLVTRQDMRAQTRRFMDRRVLHYLYALVVGLALACASAALIHAPMLDALGRALSGPLCMLALVPAFSLIMRACAHLPNRVIVLLVLFLCGLAMIERNLSPLEWLVFFMAGHGFAAHSKAFAQRFAAAPVVAGLCGPVVVLVALLLLRMPASAEHHAAGFPLVAVALGLCAGFAAFATGVVLMGSSVASALLYAGQRARMLAVLWLPLFAVLLAALTRSGASQTPATSIILIGMAGLCLCLLLIDILRSTPLVALEVRPRWARLREWRPVGNARPAPVPKHAHQAQALQFASPAE